MTPRQRTAARLAANATATAYLNRPVTDAVIDPRTGADRSYRPVPGRTAGDYAALFITLAAREGETALCGPTFSAPQQSDDGRAAYAECLRLTNDDGPDAAALLHEARERVRGFVRDHGDIISALAMHLDERGEMSGPEIEHALHRVLDGDQGYVDPPDLESPPAPSDVWGEPQSADYADDHVPTRYEADRRMRIAVHESSHALAGIAVHCPVYGIEIEPDDPTMSGRTVYASRDKLENDPRVEMFIAAAGPEGERLLLGPSPDDHQTHSGDAEQCQRAATRYCADDPRVASKMMGTCRRDAAKFVRHYAPMIATLANELYARGIMTGADIHAFLSGAR